LQITVFYLTKGTIDVYVCFIITLQQFFQEWQSCVSVVHLKIDTCSILNPLPYPNIPTHTFSPNQSKPTIPDEKIVSE
jgi:hypothetical protein